MSSPTITGIRKRGTEANSGPARPIAVSSARVGKPNPCTSGPLSWRPAHWASARVKAVAVSRMPCWCVVHKLFRNATKPLRPRSLRAPGSATGHFGASSKPCPGAPAAGVRADSTPAVGSRSSVRARPRIENSPKIPRNPLNGSKSRRLVCIDDKCKLSVCPPKVLLRSPRLYRPCGGRDRIVGSCAVTVTDGCCRPAGFAIGAAMVRPVCCCAPRPPSAPAPYFCSVA